MLVREVFSRRHRKAVRATELSYLEFSFTIVMIIISIWWSWFTGDDLAVAGGGDSSDQVPSWLDSGSSWFDSGPTHLVAGTAVALMVAVRLMTGE